MSDQSFTEAVEKDIAAGGPWATPAPVTRSSEEAVVLLGQAMLISAKQVALGSGTSILDRARMVTGELELLGYWLAPLSLKEPRP